MFYTPNGTTVSSKGVPDHWILEYLSGLATAGTYGSAPTKQQLFGPGIKKPGDVVQTVVATTSSVHGGTTSTSDVALGTSTINPLRILASGHWQNAASSTDALASLKIKRGGSTKVGPAVVAIEASEPAQRAKKYPHSDIRCWAEDRHPRYAPTIPFMACTISINSPLRHTACENLAQ